MATNRSSFIPTSRIYDYRTINELDIKSDEFKRFLVNLTNDINNLSIALNEKDSGHFPLGEFITGQNFFPNPTPPAGAPKSDLYRPIYRTTVNFGALPNATSKSVAHGITVDSNLTYVYAFGVATNTTAGTALLLPYADVTDSYNVSVFLTSTHIVIGTGINRTNFDSCYITLGYIKN